jgi:hypothetical protein
MIISTTITTINKTIHFFYFSFSSSIIYIYMCLYVCVRTEQYYNTFLLVGKREKERRKKEEPSRKKGRQARSSRPNAIMDRVNTKRRKKKERIFCTHITYISNSYHSFSVHFPFSCTAIVMFMLIVAIIVHAYDSQT